MYVLEIPNLSAEVGDARALGLAIGSYPPAFPFPSVPIIPPSGALSVNL